MAGGGTTTRIVLCWWCASLILAQHINVSSLFDEFITKYGRHYVKGSIEYNERLRIFKENLSLHKKLNADRTSAGSAIYGVTKFSDLSQDEFKAQFLSSLSVPSQVGHPAAVTQTSVPHQVGNIPASIDWRDKGVVTGVKNQASCGGCWAYATVETVESMYAMSRDLVALSVQEVLDCSYSFGGLSSCQGGDTCNAFQWMQQTKTPLPPASDYPTTNRNKQPCKMSSYSTGVLVTNHTCNSFVGNEQAMLSRLAEVGPVSVTIDASMWSNYQGGIIQHHCGEVANNHAVQIVGYNKSGTIPYYIAKNSWGDDFGIKGYVYLEANRNMCGLAERVSTAGVRRAPGP